MYASPSELNVHADSLGPEHLDEYRSVAMHLNFRRVCGGTEFGPFYKRVEFMDREQIEQVSKALGDQTRLMIFEAIAAREQMNCGEIVALRGVTPATVSHHLKTLVDAGLIESRREGQFVYSKAVPETVKEYVRSLGALVRKKKSAKSR
jgi:ArsR family transcriptional regulator, arsenate/arsenite/antimonite-responsive transcriptional repressor